MTAQGPTPPAEETAPALARIDALWRAGRPQEALQDCRALAAANPAEPAVLAGLAFMLMNLGEFAQAEQSFRRALACKPDAPAIHYGLGLVLQKCGRGEEALTAFRAAVALKADHADALAQIGMILSVEGLQDEAMEPLDAAIAADPAHFAARYYRGCVLVRLERIDEAVADLEAALKLRPGSYEALFALGNAHARAQQNDRALEAYQAALERAPEFLPAHYAYNQMAWTLGRADLNLASYARARARVGDRPDLLLAEANQRLHQKDVAAAEQLLRRAHATAPERHDVANALAHALGMQKRFGDAVELLEAAVKAQPASVPHRRELGIALLQDGQFTDARRVLEEALALAPFDQLTLAHLTLVYRELGDARLDRLVDTEKFVRVFDLPPPPGYADTGTFNRALGEELLGLHTRKVEPFDQSLRGGTQTLGHLFEIRAARAVRELRERISEAVQDYIRGLPENAAHPFLARRDESFSFSNAWSCRLRGGGFHANHVHHEGWISSAYYVALPDAVADDEGRQGWLKFGESHLGLGERDRPARAVKPAIGKLVLFPSYFWHGTVPFASDDTRLTVAFDVTPGKSARTGRRV